jgi:hypothetical protein
VNAELLQQFSMRAAPMLAGHAPGAYFPVAEILAAVHFSASVGAPRAGLYAAMTSAVMMPIASRNRVIRNLRLRFANLSARALPAAEPVCRLVTPLAPFLR